MFPTAHSTIVRNAVGEPIGWDTPPSPEDMAEYAAEDWLDREDYPDADEDGCCPSDGCCGQPGTVCCKGSDCQVCADDDTDG